MFFQDILNSLMFLRVCAHICSHAVLRVMSSGKFNYIKRDVKRLIPFESENEGDVDDDVVRARRNAAVNADFFRQALM